MEILRTNIVIEYKINIVDVILNYTLSNLIKFHAIFTKQFPYKYHRPRPIFIKVYLTVYQFIVPILRAEY